jgi:hypothetical protein
MKFTYKFSGQIAQLQCLDRISTGVISCSDHIILHIFVLAGTFHWSCTPRPWKYIKWRQWLPIIPKYQGCNTDQNTDIYRLFDMNCQLLRTSETTGRMNNKCLKTKVFDCTDCSKSNKCLLCSKCLQAFSALRQVVYI